MHLLKQLLPPIHNKSHTHCIAFIITTITGFFLVFITIQNSQINIDTLTILNNKRSAFNYLDEQIRLLTDKKSTTVYMIDVNDFKEINDTWGHIEGEHALNIIGSSLKTLSQKYKISVSIGYANASNSDITIYQLLEQADAMLYKEKEAFHKDR